LPPRRQQLDKTWCGFATFGASLFFFFFFFFRILLLPRRDIDRCESQILSRSLFLGFLAPF
jgi:hypothetical protein